MKPVTLISAVALVWFCIVAGAQAQTPVRETGESDLAFAGRILHFGEDSDAHVTTTTWNGAPTLIADYLVAASDQTVRHVDALVREADGGYQRLQVTLGEEEGGTAQLAAVGLARADHSGRQSLITILTWSVNHPTLVQGTDYEIRLFAPPRPGQAALAELPIGRHFTGGCECWHGDGPRRRPEYHTHARYRTIAEVRRELRRLGY